MLKLLSTNVAAETRTVYLSYKGAYGRCCPSWQLVIHAHASWLSKKTKLYKNLTIHMRPVATALNYSIENIRNDIHQKIYEKSQFDSPVWASLALAATSFRNTQVEASWQLKLFATWFGSTNVQFVVSCYVVSKQD